jgi:hypothetical protein
VSSSAFQMTFAASGSRSGAWTTSTSIQLQGFPGLMGRSMAALGHQYDFPASEGAAAAHAWAPGASRTSGRMRPSEIAAHRAPRLPCSVFNDQGGTVAEVVLVSDVTARPC